MILASLVALLGVLALSPAPALAENSVVSSEPADGATVATSPAQLVIVFAEDLGEANTVALDCNTDLFTLGRPQVGDDGRTLTVEIAEPLPRATCVARWRVSDADGEPNGAGNITFNVQNDPEVVDTTAESTTPTTTADTTATPDPTAPTAGGETEVAELSNVDTGQGPLWLGRLLSVLGLAVLLGSLVVIAAAWPEGVEYLIAVRFIRSTWIVATIGTLLYVAAASAAVTGDSLGAGFSPAAWADLLDAGWPGRAALARLLLVVAAAWVAFRPDRVIDPTTQMAALGIPALAVVTIGISRTDGDLAAVGVAMGILHALAMAVWLGGAILLARVVLAGPGDEDLVHAVRGFGRLSNLAIIVTVVTGVVQMVRLDGGELFSTGHGRVVVLKAVVVAAMVFIAISARQIINQRLARANEMSVPMADRLRRAFGTEAAIGVVALAASAWLLSLAPANVDTTPSIDYAISRTIEVPEADFEAVVKLTRTTAGLAGLEVEVKSPAAGLSGMELVFTAPPNDQDIGTITQPVPLTEPGVAVRLESVGLPLTAPGDWTLQINATTPSGLISTEPQSFTINNADGSAPTTAITVPPSVTVTIAPTTVPE